MQIIKLTEVSKYKLQQAHDNALSVLNEIKRHTLENQALEDMKALEQSVQNLEIFLLGK